MVVGEIVGVECGACHSEVFQTFEREARLSPGVTVKLRVCKICARRIDDDNNAQTGAENLKDMSKAERHLIYTEQSRAWARSWEGKHVIIHFEDNRQIRGWASYGSKNEDTGWGRVRVIFDENEQRRVSFVPNEYHHERKYPVIDHIEYGLSSCIILEGYEGKPIKPYGVMINWGSSHNGDYVLEEVDPEADRQATEAAAEKERLEKEAEIARHIGEGI